MNKVGSLVSLLAFLLSSCSAIDSTQELDQQQIALLTRQIYHIKPKIIKHPKKEAPQLKDD